MNSFLKWPLLKGWFYSDVPFLSETSIVISLCSVRVHVIWLEPRTPGLRQELGSRGRGLRIYASSHTPVPTQCPMSSPEDQEEEVLIVYH